LRSYAADYLREEVAAEGLVRNLPVFSRFLDIAALSDGETVNYSTIARDCGVSSQTVSSYFDILVDSLLGSWVPSYRRQPKRRVQTSPKFYFSDVGLVNFLSRRGRLRQGSPLYGKAFENWLFHELSTYNEYRERYASLCFWRTSSGIEVDFIVGDMDVAIEAKASGSITSDHTKGLRELAVDYPDVKRRILVCLDSRRRVTPEDIEVWPAEQFARALWAGEIF